MYLFTRTTRLGAGDLRESMGWAIGLTEKVNQVVELDVELWQTVFSPRLGTLAWTCVVEDLAQLEAADAKLAADDAYLDLVASGAKFSSGEAIDDGLLQLVHAEGEPIAKPAYASVAQSSIHPGAIVKAVEVGSELAKRASAATGIATGFGIASTGLYGSVAWITGYESVEALQKASGDLAADASFGQFIDDVASKVFVGANTTQTVYRRVI